MRFLATLVTFLAIAFLNTVFAQKTDIVYLKNGDRITGEVSEMSRGEILLETDALGNIYIKWHDVAGFETDKTIQFETSNATRFFGTVSRVGEGELSIASDEEEQVVRADEIVYFSRIKADQSWWDAIDKDLRVGFSYTQASDVMRWNIGAGFIYKTLDYGVSVRADSLVTNKRDGEDSRRADVTGNFQRYLKNRYFWFAGASAQTNDELGVDRRLLVSGGAGRYVFQRPSSELRVSLGFAGNYENPTGDPMVDSPNDLTFEGLLDIDWSLFKLSTPSSRVNAKLEYYPSLSKGGRDRVDLKIHLRQEFVKDLFWVVEAFSSHDSDPPPGAVSGDDYGITTSLAYEW